MKYIEMFGGIGGFSLGIERATKNMGWLQQEVSERTNSKNIEDKRGNGNCWKCVGYYEIDKYAVQTYNKNFGTDWKPTDITKLHSRGIPKHDILCAGFPCQSFSIAGKRKGFEDTRGTLFFDICRIAKYHRTPLLFLENVKGLLSHDEGRTFATILKTLSELGYSCEWQVLNSKHYGVPQNRERVFIIGHLRGFGGKQVFPLGESSKEAAEELEKKPIIIGTTKSDTAQGTNSRSWVHDTEGIVGALDSTTYKQPKQILIPTNTELGYDIAENRKDGIRLQFENSKTARGRVVKGYSQALQTSGQIGVLDTPLALDLYNKKVHSDRTPALTEPHHNSLRLLQNNRIRKLTPTECERLQGFPDNWTEGVSDTQRYKQLGNAVTTNVIEAIVRKLGITFCLNITHTQPLYPQNSAISD